MQEAQAASAIIDSSSARLLGIAGVIGLGLGIAIAYFRGLSRQSFLEKTEPGSVLRAPLLADIPEFAEESLESSLPVRDHPQSITAEAYRFAASSLTASIRGRGIRSLAFLTSVQGQGKTTTLLNTAFAAALDGYSVLIIDCDFASHEASRILLADDAKSATGLTDILDGRVSIDQALRNVNLGGGTVREVPGSGHFTHDGGNQSKLGASHNSVRCSC